ncbi:MAG TPA: cytochrome c oxidase subunit 3 [Povalibacter sp.]|uniref:cytochrome c oxidase subunit 3 n=1 Tax=Povalibacter sp. TaxID=1962978 RepID=UPI002C5DB033|nr:cytochrome c oxidase subunit 3 [Povalibacter sp.]HMN44700.1 cytochrome c oxidase subunit 3 [Povalibacter sp.]
MSLTVAYSALITGILVWLVLVTRFRTKSWEPLGVTAEIDGQRFPPQRVGLWVFLAVVTSLFGLFIAAFFMRMGHDVVAPDWKPFPEPMILWINTAALIIGSVAMQWARSSVAKGDAVSTRRALIVAGVMTLAFLVGQVLAWRLMIMSGYFQPYNPAVAFFYLLTLLHALHVIGGMVVWARMLLRMRAVNAAPPATEAVDVRRRFRLSVELCTVYWHYLLFVWLVVFALLLTHSIDSEFVFDRLC